ncbi:hypothetical protein SAY87_012835 [Trapa incisa]|uniref:non-specific serine/threonine protein kinase n=1 Tax=Trapa incisa TaxID=236973 RepID=A0AAN7GTK8_9MYRT|nr:hypothetical protein SAY87_012835 [Trapa incisa]
MFRRINYWSQLTPPTLPEPEALAVTDRSQKAWHLFSILLSLGRPAHSFELASICTLFHARPEIIRLLCEIPSSPICLRSDFFVTPSLTSLVDFFHLMSNSNCFDPPRQLKIEKSYYRKRKRNSEKHELLPLAKRRIDLSPGEVGVGCCSPAGFLDPREKLTSELGNLQDEQGRIAVHRTCKIEEIFDQELSTKMVHQPPDPAPNVSPQMMGNIVLSIEESKVEIDVLGKESPQPSTAVIKNGNASINDIVCCDGNFVLETNEDGRAAEAMKEHMVTGQVSSLREFEFEAKHECESKKDVVRCENVVLPIESLDRFPELECSTLQKPLEKQSFHGGASCGSNISFRKKDLNKSLENKRVGSVHQEKEKLRRIGQSGNAHQKLKQVDCAMLSKERKGNSPAPKDQVKEKVLPEFECYIVEEEEGSGGYGTVYRARRKKDGRTVAIKYPHANAHKHHSTNELRMLERFGGKNFIIKCEGSFKSGSADCFVLEHVEHDRPEVLKKEINVLQLQWYGYCLFRALASLHKQGVVHRDVKPGNFLFSRKANNGYLIDFNLAMVKIFHTFTGKLKARLSENLNPPPRASNNSVLRGKMKLQGVKTLDAKRKDEIKILKSPLERKNLNRKVMNRGNNCNDLGSWNTVSRQGAEGSGITSARDATSTRTASAERMREPLPQQGRKELINLAQKLQMTREISSVPAPKRKRVAAPPGRIDERLLNITPMPINLNSVSVNGAGLRPNEGDCNKEGPCVGTKGFRAPEVLFRSSHQGLKLDMWSAGVTLLYLVTGKTPFLGDPEQNIRDIAKIRGSEDLWEVAKLHNREISFPADLYDAKYLTTMTLQEWCQRNTRRPDFLKEVPILFFDLLDKCLTVNPRQRISSDEALKHEFFAPCLEELKK